MIRIKHTDLMNMNDHAERYGFNVHLAYARADNLLFGERIYKTGAALYLHKTLAKIVITASKSCADETPYQFVLYDGLRPIEAQQRMLRTQRVIDNPHWLEPPVLLSSPGGGGHPRGMAIDIALVDKRGALLDMGTPFDYFAEDARPAHNPAHRSYHHLTKHHKSNRDILNHFMIAAADKHDTKLHLYDEEWWDFRLPKDIYEQYAPISDADLPPAMRMMPQQ